MFPRLPLLSEEDEPDEWLGGAMFVLLDDPEDWVHRRVESATFLDASSIRRRVSVDLDLPREQTASIEGHPLVPLALLEKGPLVDLDVKDESGASLPVLNAEENGYVAWCLLARVAQQALFAKFRRPTPIPSHLLEDLKTIAGGSAEAATHKVETIQRGADPDVREGLAVPVFLEYATSLASRFLLLVEVVDDGRQRRVLKFSYTQALEKAAGRGWERALGMLGWKSTQFDVDSPGVGEGQSYHFEFQGPPGLDVQRALMFASSVWDEDDDGRIHQGQVVGSRAHIYAPDAPLGADGTASVWLRPPRPGLLRACLVTSAAILAVFVFFWWDHRITSVRHGLAVPLLLAAPALVASFIIRPGEHGMATDLLAGVRAAIGLAALAAYSGAIAVSGGLSKGNLEGTWKVLLIVSVLCFSSLTLAYAVGRGEILEEASPDAQAG